MMTLLRLFGLVIGYIVILMWLAGVAGVADFTLTFRVR